MTLAAHDHRMWAAIALYSGGEDNAFYRRAEPGLVESGGRSLRPGDVCLLGSEAIHAVTNPTSEYAGAIHVYGGDFFATARSEWTGDPLREQPYDVNRVLATFEAANRAAEATELARAVPELAIEPAHGGQVRGFARVVGVHADLRIHEVAVGDRVDRNDLDVRRRAGWDGPADRVGVPVEVLPTVERVVGRVPRTLPR